MTTIASHIKAATGQTCFNRYATPGERRVARTLIRRALEAGYTISVFDGVDWAGVRLTTLKAVEALITTTDEDALAFRDADRLKVGTVWLVWGNDETGEELIADYTDNERIRALVEDI